MAEDAEQAALGREWGALPEADGKVAEGKDAAAGDVSVRTGAAAAAGGGGGGRVAHQGAEPRKDLPRYPARPELRSAPSGDPRLVFLYASPLVGFSADTGMQSGMPRKVEEIDPLNAEKEKRLLKDTLWEARKRIALRMEVASSRNLRKQVTLGCRALHYTGHGMTNCLAFEDDTGAMHPLHVDVLRRLFAAGDGAEGVKFVFVSACHSQIAGEAFVSAGVKHVVAVRWDRQVSDRASYRFAESFYLALLVGKTVRNAFDIANETVKAEPDCHFRDGTFLLLHLIMVLRASCVPPHPAGATAAAGSVYLR